MTRSLPARFSIAALLGLAAGCAITPRSQIEEGQRLTQTLRDENQKLRDRVLVLENQNRDLSERAVDDAKRLAAQDQAIAQFEHSVQVYQDDRRRLENAYRRLAASLGASGPIPDEEPAEKTTTAAGRKSTRR